MKDDPAAVVESFKRRMLAMFGFAGLGLGCALAYLFGPAAYESAFMVGFWVALAGAAGSALWLIGLIPR